MRACVWCACEMLSLCFVLLSFPQLRVLGLKVEPSQDTKIWTRSPQQDPVFGSWITTDAIDLLARSQTQMSERYAKAISPLKQSS